MLRDQPFPTIREKKFTFKGKLCNMLEISYRLNLSISTVERYLWLGVTPDELSKWAKIKDDVMRRVRDAYTSNSRKALDKYAPGWRSVEVFPNQKAPQNTLVRAGVRNLGDLERSMLNGLSVSSSPDLSVDDPHLLKWVTIMIKAYCETTANYWRSGRFHPCGPFEVFDEYLTGEELAKLAGMRYSNLGRYVESGWTVSQILENRRVNRLRS